MRFFNTSYHNHSILAHIVIGGLFIVLASIGLVSGYLPTHDTIEWHGAYHYFYSSVERGIIPYWNPYSRTGTPFFINFQSFGLLEPSHFIFIFFQKITGWTTLTTYILHEFFMYYLFIIGTYYTLRMITKHHTSSLVFSIVLLLACFPSIMRQIGALRFFAFIPLMTFFLFLFFEESKVNRKGFYLFLISFFFAASLNIHVPMWTLFYLLLFVIFVFLFKIADFKVTVRFLTSKYGFLWGNLSMIVILLISSPVIVLYHELRHDTSYFPTARVIVFNQDNLVKCYASDIEENPLSEEFTNNNKVSLTLGNLVGLFLEPFQQTYVLKLTESVPYFDIDIDLSPLGSANNYIKLFGFETSEIVLYLGILPLFCIGIAVTKVRDRYTYLFASMALLFLFVSCNFKIRLSPSLSFTQHIMLTLFPVLKMSDLLQSGGTLFLFCLVMLSAIGFRRIRYSWSNVFWIGVFFFLSCRYLAFIYLSTLLGRNLLLSIFFFVSTSILLLMCMQKRISGIILHRNRVTRLILFFDLLLFVLFHVIYVKHAVGFVSGGTYYESSLSNRYRYYLQDKDILHTKRERDFMNYRIPFSPQTPERYFHTFFGHEIYEAEKVAFPAIVRSIQSKQSGEKLFARYDHFYMTTSYYDYLVNVNLEKQLVTSHIISPILNFFPRENTIFVDHKYQVVEQINNSSLQELRTLIFIERDSTIHASSLDASQFFDPNNYLEYTQEEVANFNQNLHVRYPGNRDIALTIADYDINHLSLVVDTPYDGYLYFGDGYSKHWKALVDGRKATIEKTNVNFKSVYTPEGKHTVEFIFDPVFFRYSLYAYMMGNGLFFMIFITYLSKQFFLALQKEDSRVVSNTQVNFCERN